MDLSNTAPAGRDASERRFTDFKTDVCLPLERLSKNRPKKQKTGGPQRPSGQAVKTIVLCACASFQNLKIVLKTFDLNRAGNPFLGFPHTLFLPVDVIFPFFHSLTGGPQGPSGLSYPLSFIPLSHLNYFHPLAHLPPWAHKHPSLHPLRPCLSSRCSVRPYHLRCRRW